MAAPNILTFTLENFETEVLKAARPVLVDFWAEWCGPCKALGPILDELAQEYDGKVNVGKVNVDDFQDLAARFGVRSIPTLLMFKNGEVADQMVGARGKRELKELFERVAA